MKLITVWSFIRNWCSFILFLMLFPFFFHFDMTSALLWMNWCTHSPIATAINIQLSSNSCFCVFHARTIYTININTIHNVKGATTKMFYVQEKDCQIIWILVSKAKVSCSNTTLWNNKRDFDHICAMCTHLYMYQCVFLNCICFFVLYLFLHI